MSLLTTINLIIFCFFIFITPKVSFAGVFFSDGFESGNTSHVDANSGAKWNGGACRGTIADGTCVSNEIVHSGKYALKFFFKGNPDLSDDAWAEQRFSLGKTYDEVYIRFYIYFSSNYVIRDAIGADNTKLFLLWGDSYSKDMNKIAIEYGKSMHFGLKAKETGWPNFSPSCSGATGYIKSIPKTPTGIADIKGKWTEIEIHARRDTGSGDGIFQMWINGKLEINAQNFAWIGAPCGLNKFFRHGYLMGWSNSGFNKDTAVYIDDVVFSTNYIPADDVGSSATSSTTYPATPKDFKSDN